MHVWTLCIAFKYKSRFFLLTPSRTTCVFITPIIRKTLIYPMIAFKDFCEHKLYLSPSPLPPPRQDKSTHYFYIHRRATSARGMYAHKNRNVVYSVCCYKGWSVIVEDERKKEGVSKTPGISHYGKSIVIVVVARGSTARYSDRRWRPNYIRTLIKCRRYNTLCRSLC